MSAVRIHGDGELPDGWQMVKLGDVARVDTGGTPSRDVLEYWDGDIPWMASAEINQSRVTDTAERISEKGLSNSNAKVFPAGTVMVAMNGQGATRGKAAVLGIDSTCNQSLAAIRAEPGACNPFIYHVLSTGYEKLRGLTGEGRNGLNLELIRGFRFVLPPLPEQRAIADVLDSIDDAIERTEAAIAATETLRDSLLHELLTRGVPGWHTEWKDVPGIGTIPADWEVVRLGEVIADGPTNGIYKPDSDYGDGWPIIRIDDFISGELVNQDRLRRVRVEPKEARRYAAKAGDILINRVNSLSHIGKTVLVPKIAEVTLFESNMMKLTLCDTVHPKFGEFVLLSEFARRHFVARAKKAVQQASINQQDVAALPFPLPHPDEQETIANMVTGVDCRIDTERLDSNATRQAKSTVADALLNGRVRTR